ncbi:hypothetical protein GCM10025862_17990 [Arsenicicoccus piscis]|uniref:SMI1/KNR4 family protein n=3 Tax=Arsenicicoccus piscis TaxID=673954 RepID=A0ABQ6HQ23_9MICO|nr:hypothetical protein GCM10025862_17990 [Arsenicicoccus piscis]
MLMWLGLRGVLSVADWWGTPAWPFIVDEFFRRLDDPDYEHWRTGGHPGPPPEGLARDEFRELLLSAPDELPTEFVDFCIHRGAIGFVRPDRSGDSYDIGG